MKEQVVQFGANGGLVGILSAGGQSPDAPVALMFNSGVLHRVGAFRLWVDLARELAAEKIPSLRFDLHGLGDSAVSAGGDVDLDPVVQAVNDLIAAMDLVESQLGPRQFVIFGLCSGAHYAHLAAKADSRLRGLVFLDGYGYKTPAYYVNHQLRRVTSPRRWKNLIKRTLNPSLAGMKNDETFDKADQTGFPSPETAQSDILSFLDDGRRVFFIYTAGVPEYFNHERQFWDMYPRLKPRSNLTYRYYAKTDHTFALVAERNALTKQLVGFVAGQKAALA